MAQQDTVKIAESLVKAVNYAWADEWKNFEEENDVEVVINSEKDLDKWIKKCEKEGMTDHIFYHLMVLRSAYYETFEEFEQD